MPLAVIVALIGAAAVFLIFFALAEWQREKRLLRATARRNLGLDDDAGIQLLEVDEEGTFAPPDGEPRPIPSAARYSPTPGTVPAEPFARRIVEHDLMASLDTTAEAAQARSVNVDLDMGGFPSAKTPTRPPKGQMGIIATVNREQSDFVH